MGIMSSIKYWY